MLCVVLHFETSYSCLYQSTMHDVWISGRQCYHNLFSKCLAMTFGTHLVLLMVVVLYSNTRFKISAPAPVLKIRFAVYHYWYQVCFKVVPVLYQMLPVLYQILPVLYQMLPALKLEILIEVKVTVRSCTKKVAALYPRTDVEFFDFLLLYRSSKCVNLEQNPKAVKLFPFYEMKKVPKFVRAPLLCCGGPKNTWNSFDSKLIFYGCASLFRAGKRIIECWSKTGSGNWFPTCCIADSSCCFSFFCNIFVVILLIPRPQAFLLCFACVASLVRFQNVTRLHVVGLHKNVKTGISSASLISNWKMVAPCPAQSRNQIRVRFRSKDMPSFYLPVLRGKSGDGEL